MLCQNRLPPNQPAPQQRSDPGPTELRLSANRCVDIKDWNGANGAALQLWDCAGTTNQKWSRF